MPRIALVQRSPAFLDRAETTSIAVSSVREAGQARRVRRSARLVGLLNRSGLLRGRRRRGWRSPD